MTLNLQAFDQIKSHAKSAPTKCEPTTQQLQKFSKLKTAMLWAQPGIAHLWYTMMQDTHGDTAYFTKDIGIAATDDKQMFINPDTFLSRPLDEQVYIASHEIRHAMLNHCGQAHIFRTRKSVTFPDGVTLPFDEKTLAWSQDCVINAILDEGRIGARPDDAWIDPKITSQMSVMDAYRISYEPPPPPPKGKSGKDTEEGGSSGAGEPKDGNGGQGQGGSTPGGKGGFDDHLEPGTSEGKDPGQAQQDRPNGEWKMATSAAQALSKAQGKMPLALERLFKSLLEPEVDWTDQIRSFFARKVGNSATTWNSLDPAMVIRGVGAPGRQGKGAGLVIVATDTSGSVTQAMMDKFMAEVGGIISDVRPKTLILMQCDARVQSYEECDDVGDLLRVKIKGGGGTSFKPVFKRIAKEDLEPDALIYLTDGYGDFPSKAPSYPMIWGNITPGMKYPFGDVIDLPFKA